MHRLLIASALLAATAQPAASDTPAQFTDAACPNATAIGRHLNDLANSATVLTSDLMQTALQMVAVYQDCAAGYDRTAAGAPGGAVSEGSGITARRIYAHLALARAQQRVGNYYSHQQKYGDARAAYDAALKSLATISAIDVGSAAPDSAERSLLAKALTFEKEIETAEATLPKGGATAATPSAGSATNPAAAPSATPDLRPPQHS